MARCAYCPGKASGGWGDHIVPRAWGGRSTRDNQRPCCRPCNMLRAECGHCPAALACVRAVIGNRWGDNEGQQRSLIQLWGWAGAKAQHRAASRLGVKGAVKAARRTWPPFVPAANQIKPAGVA